MVVVPKIADPVGDSLKRVEAMAHDAVRQDAGRFINDANNRMRAAVHAQGSEDRATHLEWAASKLIRAAVEVRRGNV